MAPAQRSCRVLLLIALLTALPLLAIVAAAAAGAATATTLGNKAALMSTTQSSPIVSRIAFGSCANQSAPQAATSSLPFPFIFLFFSQSYKSCLF
ncbi:hypothetical protein ACMD2_04256 [Ananas comosus]|uniref:Uncharacterized protein n=1 Tax=Ananas comosus TaxID=4615 RepID=A0A199UEF8_ANACO|nr:hypothetical protein ACMD2_04256 [Ananas comosus]